MWINTFLKRLLTIRINDKFSFSLAKFSKILNENEQFIINKNNLLKTDMFVQEGACIYELPIIIKKVSDLKKVLQDQKNVGNIFSHNFIKPTSKLELNTWKGYNSSEGAAILFASDLELLKNLDVEQIYKEIKVLETADKESSRIESIIGTEINSRVALLLLKRIIDLERKNRNLKKSPKFIADRHTLITQLIELIVSSQDSEMILEALSVLIKDKLGPPNNLYKDVLVDEALIRLANGDFSIQQLITVAKILVTSRDYKDREAIDYFWVGLITKQEDINADHLLPLFKLLVYMKQSKSSMQLLLERRLTKIYHKLSVSQMAEILNIFEKDLCSPMVLKCVSKWSNSHLKTISKLDLLEFIESLIAVKYINPSVEQAIENILTTRTMRSNDHNLMVTVAIYCSTVRLRNVHIFNRVIKYFEKYANNLPLASSVKIISAFGELNFLPRNKENFWIVFEEILDKTFSNLQVDKVLNILLSCAYVNKYFPKYTSEIFSPRFLNQLNFQNNIDYVQLLRDKLYLLDTAMTIDCIAYKGPILHRSNKLSPMFIDSNIKCIISRIYKYLVNLAGGEEKLSRHVVLNQLSSASLYTLDALIHKKSKSNAVLELNLKKEKNDNTAILVLLPHFYCWNSTKLMGQQAMKIRHLRKLGFRVMLLDFQTLWVLHKQPEQLKKYLNHNFEMAYEALR